MEQLRPKDQLLLRLYYLVGYDPGEIVEKLNLLNFRGCTGNTQ